MIREVHCVIRVFPRPSVSCVLQLIYSKRHNSSMSYSRVEYPRTSRTQRTGSHYQRGSAAPYNPRPVNSPPLMMHHEEDGSGSLGEEETSGRDYQGRGAGIRTEERGMQRWVCHLVLSTLHTFLVSFPDPQHGTQSSFLSGDLAEDLEMKLHTFSRPSQHSDEERPACSD